MLARKHTVKLNQESLEFARLEGEEIAKAKKLRHLDPEVVKEQKIANSTFGCYAQQLLIEQVGARRVTRREVPNFSHDVVVDHQKLLEFFGWEPSWEWAMIKTARLEIKSVHMEGRRWISFHDEYFAHALHCARHKWFDYLAAFGVNVINEEEKIAEVLVLGILTPHAFTNRETYLPSKHQVGQHYLKTQEVHRLNLGKIFI